MRLLLAFVVILFLAGCAASGPAYTSQASEAPKEPTESKLVIFRPDSSQFLSARATRIKLDEVTIGECQPVGFNTFTVEPGQRVLEVDIWDAPGSCKLPIELTGGQTHYFEIQPRKDAAVAGMLGGLVGAMIESSGKECGGQFMVMPVEKDVAEAALTSLKQTE